MLQHSKAFSGFSVSDIRQAQEFYGQTLGLPLSETDGMLQLHLAGGCDALVYLARPLRRHSRS